MPEIGVRDLVKVRLLRTGAIVSEGVDIRGHSGLKRRFDIAVRGAGRSLLRRTDTDSPQYFQQSDELYTVAVNDLLNLAPSRRLFFTWNADRPPSPDRRVLAELESVSVTPIGSDRVDALVSELVAGSVH